jgi:hypothetical protein
MWRSALIAAALLLAAGSAQASEASDVAERGAFLLGHAYRCGVKAEQLQSTAQLVHTISGALAADDDEKAAADKVFAERFVVSAVADSIGQLLPSCASVKRELTELERHDPEAAASGSSTPPGQERLSNAMPSHGGAKHAAGARAVRPVKPAGHSVASRQPRRHQPAI